MEVDDRYMRIIGGFSSKLRPFTRLILLFTLVGSGYCLYQIATFERFIFVQYRKEDQHHSVYTEGSALLTDYSRQGDGSRRALCEGVILRRSMMSLGCSTHGPT